MNNKTHLHTKPHWCVPINRSGTRIVLMSVHNRTPNPQGCSQVVWKAYFDKWLVFIPLCKFFFSSVGNAKTGLFDGLIFLLWSRALMLWIDVGELAFDVE